jgi:hypothetical protein
MNASPGSTTKLVAERAPAESQMWLLDARVSTDTEVLEGAAVVVADSEAEAKRLLTEYLEEYGGSVEIQMCEEVDPSLDQPDVVSVLLWQV